MNLVIKPEFGYVVAVGVGSAFVALWHGIGVGGARKKYGVKYPTMYATKAECKDADAFNCFQRAHGNFMENYTQFIMLLFLAGIEHPKTAAVMGTIYLAGRIHYALGYQTGDPKKRMQGAWQYIGLLSLLGMAGKLAFNMISSA